MKKTAFITGITGQDGSYLAELLIDNDYTVHGLVHRPDALATSNIAHLLHLTKAVERRLVLHAGSFEDATHLRRIIAQAQPDEFYHLAGQSSPRLSLDMPEATFDSIGTATLRLLEIIRDLPQPPRFLHASSAEVFGSSAHSPQDELTPLNPTTPYGAAKSFSQQMTSIYRATYKLPACSAILYNHESPRRSGQFLTMKVARAAARIKCGLQSEVLLGSVIGQRDWGWAPDYVKGMWLMLQLETVEDFVLASGRSHSVEEFVRTAFAVLGLDWRQHVKFDIDKILSVEPISPRGNPEKARRLLGWKNTVPFEEIVERLVRSEYDKTSSGKLIGNQGRCD